MIDNQIDDNVDGRIAAHHATIAKKPMIAEVFREIHQLFLTLDRQFFGQVPGLRVELGAGVYPVKLSDPAVLATDVVPAPALDRILNAEAMELTDASVRAFYLQNCFHHFPHPERFFAELQRTLTVGGGAILIEPANGWLAGLIYPRLFKSEGYDKKMPGWHAAIDGPMHGANQALSDIVFRRDRAQFTAQFPDLEIVYEAPLPNYVRYLVSGGLNFPQLLPTFTIPALKLLERLLMPLHRVLALHHVIVLRKRADV